MEKKMNGKEVLSTPLVAESPVGVEDTSEEHMLKLESLEEKVAEYIKFDFSNIAGFFHLPNVIPYMKAIEKERITQIHGSMTAEDSLSMAQK